MALGEGSRFHGAWRTCLRPASSGASRSMAVQTLLTTSSSSFSSSSPSPSSPSSDAAACDGPAAAVASAAASSLRAVPLRLRLNPSLIDRIKSMWPLP